MPPRYAYWTILIDNAPTAFRAKDQEDLLPTVQQLRRTNKDVTLKWFAHGRIWDSPELAVRPRPPREDDGVKRGQDWRPGGQHKDPRARFDKTRKKDRPDWRAKQRDERPPRRDRPAHPGDARAPSHDRPRDERRPGGRPRGDAPRAERPPLGGPRADKPRFETPRNDKPRFDRPRADRPPADRPQGKPFAKPHAPKRPWQDRPRPPYAPGGERDRDRRGPGKSSDRRPPSGGAGSRAAGGDAPKPWRPKPQWQPGDSDRSNRPWQGRPKTSGGDRDRSPSPGDRPPTDRRPTDKRPFAPRGDRPREDWRAKPNAQRPGWQGKPKPHTGRAPVRRDDAKEERLDKSKGPKTPGGSDSE